MCTENNNDTFSDYLCSKTIRTVRGMKETGSHFRCLTEIRFHFFARFIKLSPTAPDETKL